MSSGNEFTVAPSPWLVLWVMYVLAVVVAAIVTAAKGRWTWLIAGLLLGGVPLFYAAFLAPEPGSFWARRTGGKDPH